MTIKFTEDSNYKGVLYALAGIVAAGTIIIKGFNRNVVDLRYGYDKTLIFGDDTATIMDVDNWKDYEGEQLQIITPDGFVLLTSAFDTTAFFGPNMDENILNIAQNGISSYGEVYQLDKENNNSIFNKDLLDTKWKFNKSVTFNGNRALILSIENWKDYEGEQLQIITDDGLVLNLSSYNSKLAYDEISEIKAEDFANNYVGTDGIVTDLSTENKSGVFNYDLIDTKYGFNKAIILKDKSAVIVPVDQWTDYSGEQLQLEITDGPVVLTAAYDTILVNDIKSELKANDIAGSLADNVEDLTTGYTYDSQIYFNGTLTIDGYALEFNRGYSNGIISNDNSATALPVAKWCDYEGEQLQIELPSGDVILTSSVMLDLFNGGNEFNNASVYSKYYVDPETGKNINLSNNNYDKKTYNKNIIDTNYKFNYALKVVNGNVTIIPISKWRDYINKNTAELVLEFALALLDDDDDKDTKEPENNEQLQLILPDNTKMVTTAYDTILVKNVSDIYDIAEYFRGENGVITDLTPYVSVDDNAGINYQFIDTDFQFSYAILSSNANSQLLSVNKWIDYADGEQLQIELDNDNGFLTSYVNTTLIEPGTEGLEEIMTDAFNGKLDKNTTLELKK